MKQLDLYYNTTSESGDKLKEKKAKVSTQNEKILAYFANNKSRDFTPCEIYLVFQTRYPLTSVRRSITSLTDLGFLIKTENKRAGIYGEANFTWRINESR